MGKYYISGGIGDAVVLTSYLPEDPEEIEEIHWHSRGRPDVEPIFRKIYPGCRFINHLKCGSEFEEKMAASKDSWSDGICPEGVEDWTIVKKLYELRDRPELWHPSPILKTDVAKIKKYVLPDRYWVCQHDTPYNGSLTRTPRTIEGEEWASVLQSSGGLPVVVLGSEGSTPVPEHGDFIDLCGRTTFAESVEILKRAEGYCGIDSALSILAAQLFPAERLAVKWCGFWFSMMRSVYMAPHKEFTFLHKDFRPGWFEPAPGSMTVKAMKDFEHEGRKVLDGDILEAVPPNLAKEWIDRGSVIEWGDRGKAMRAKIEEFRRRYKALYKDMSEIPDKIQILKEVVQKKDGRFIVHEPGKTLESRWIPQPLLLDWLQTGSAVAAPTRKRTKKEQS